MDNLISVSPFLVFFLFFFFFFFLATNTNPNDTIQHIIRKMDNDTPVIIKQDLYTKYIYIFIKLHVFNYKKKISLVNQILKTVENIIISTFNSRTPL